MSDELSRLLRQLLFFEPRGLFSLERLVFGRLLILSVSPVRFIRGLGFGFLGRQPFRRFLLVPKNLQPIAVSMAGRRGDVHLE